MAQIPPDWQLPPGISRPMWDYLNDPEQARTYDQRLAETPLVDVDRQFVLRHCPQPGRLIDLGCGTGRILIPLAGHGFQVLGVDLSEEMLRIVGEKAAAAQVNVQRLKANVVELECLADAAFDYATCLFSTLGMVAGSGARRRVVAGVRRLLRPGGLFFLHVHNRWFNAWDRAGRGWLVRDWLASRLGWKEAGDRPMPGGGGLTLHHFTRREVLRLLQSNGFNIVEVAPIGLRPDGRLPAAWWFAGLRAYGYLIAARR
jgi:SAM-dependent methyltransferase